MSIARGQMRHIADKQLTEDQTSWLMLNIEKEMQRIISEKKKHTFRTLNADSALIRAYLTRDARAAGEFYTNAHLGLAYDEVARDYQRLGWLKEELPVIFESLQKGSSCLCLTCKRECGLPSQQTLSQWAARPDAGTLRNNILGQFHGLTPSRVKRLLSESPAIVPPA